MIQITDKAQLFANLMAVIPNYARRVTTPEQIKMEQAKWIKLTDDLTIEQINVALNRIIQHESDYEPSPSRFRFIAFGLFDNDAAYTMATHDDFAHPAIWHAKQAMGNDFKKLDSLTCEKQFKRHYEYYCDQVLAGRKLTEVQQQIAAPNRLPDPAYNQWKQQTVTKFGQHVKNKIDAFEAISKDWTWQQHRDFFLQELPKLMETIKI